MSNIPRARAWVEVDLDALRANFQAVRATARPRLGLLPMVKADAYGLGAERVAHALEPLEPWGFGVATVEEGAQLRAAGVRRPIVVIAPLPPGCEARAVAARLGVAVSDLNALDRLDRAAAEAGASAAFHLEVDTGMGRAGFAHADARGADGWIEQARRRVSARLEWQGLFTHFHSADEAEGAQPSREQWQRFEQVRAAVREAGVQPLVHGANSAAALRWPDYALDVVRPGIFLYGGAVPDAPPPEPVASVRARIALVREVPAGTSVGYGATWAAERPARLATVSIGYGDGVPRALGNRGAMLVRGTRCPIVGRVSMDMTVVDVSEVPEARAGDVATVIGADGAARVTLDQVAAEADTISYEILTRLTPRLPRVTMERSAGEA